MGRLAGSSVYLSGAMEHAGLSGLEWRIQAADKLKDMNIGILNPYDKPLLSHIGGETDEDRKLLILARENGNYEYLSNKMSEIVACDLRMCDKADFLICYLDISQYTAGTFHEIYTAINQHKPILLVCCQGKNYIPLWLWGVLPYELFFWSFDEMFAYLRYVDTAESVDDLNRWRFFDYNKIYGIKEG